MKSTVRETLLMREGWRYTFACPAIQPADTYFLTKTGAQTGPHAMSWDDSAWCVTSVPADLTADAPLDPLANMYNGYIARPNVWFRRYFEVPETWRGKRILLRFRGVAGKTDYYVNGVRLVSSHSSFDGVDLDITEVCRYGRNVNLVSLSCDNSRPEGWWYEGVGIYREVELTAANDVFIEESSVRCDAWCGTELPEQDGEQAWTLTGVFSLGSAFGRQTEGNAVVTITSPDGTPAGEKEALRQEDGTFTFAFAVKNPLLWEVGHGNLYTVRITWRENGETVDDVVFSTGFRTIRFDKDEGFFLNGKRTQINGMCFHEDEGNFGRAIGRDVYAKRVRLLLEMGANAYRCSHNAPAEELLELCDEAGILVMDEVRKFDSSPEGLSELRYLVQRDRTHPCVFLWSIGNEEPWQGEERGARIAQRMVREIRALDDRPVTMAMHDGFTADGAGREVDVLGVNYNHDRYDAIRAVFPEKSFLGSEDLNLCDEVCENGNPYNGTQGALETLSAIKDRPYISGYFGWAGAEYRGDHRNLAFYTDCCPINTIGDPKDGYYRYQALWTDKPVVRLCGGWNGENGKMKAVRVFSNAEAVRLLVNGNPVGDKEVTNAEACFDIPFEAGCLRAEGVTEGRVTAVDERHTVGIPVRLCLEAEQAVLTGDGASTLTIHVTAVDENGYVTPTGSHPFEAAVTGADAMVLTCDNPDPYCPPFPDHRQSILYHGHGKVVLRAGYEAGEVTVAVTSPVLEGAAVTLRQTAAPPALAPVLPNLFVNDWFVTHVWEEEPDIYAYTEDIHYMHWQKYVEPAFLDLHAMPFFDRKGYVIYCMEPDMPAVREGRVPALVFEGITGTAKILVSVRDWNNTIRKQVYREKTVAAKGAVRMELPGFAEGDRMIIKLVIAGTEPQAGLTGAVRFEI